MKKILTLVVSIALLSSLVTSPAIGAVKAGTTCSKAGSTSSVSGKKYTCIKSGKKLIWDKGVAIAKPAAESTTSTTTPSSLSPNPSPVSGTETVLDSNQRYFAIGQPCENPGQQAMLSDVNYICGHDFSQENVWQASCGQVGESGWQIEGVNGVCTAAGPTLQFWVFSNIDSIVAHYPKQAPKPGEIEKVDATPSSKPSQPGILKPGANCSGSDSSGIKISDGVLYCVPVSDGTYKFIEHFNSIPVVNNPQSPESLEACEAPDLRGIIPPQMSPLRIAHNSVVTTSKLLKHTGNLNLLVVPIDFSDAVGTSDPKSVYGQDFETMSKWFSDYSNSKLQISVNLRNSWFRAPLPSAKYDPSTWPTNDYETQRRLVQDYINQTSPQIDYSDADAVIFVYPKNAFNSTGYLHMWNADFTSPKGNLSLSVLSSLGTAGKYEPFWQWMSHELMHSMGIAMHSPADPAGWGIEWGRFSYSEALLPWNQMLFDWINPDQYYCATSSNVVTTKLTLIPQESTKPGLRGIFIRISNSEVLMVVSYRNDTWAYEAPNDFYGTMVALYDTSKQVDMTGEQTDDTFDGVKYQKPGLWLHPNNQVKDDNSYSIMHTGEGGALMYLGDSVSYKGVTVKLADSNNFDTVEISRS